MYFEHRKVNLKYGRITLSIDESVKSSVMVLLSPVISSLLSNLTSRGYVGASLLTRLLVVIGAKGVSMSCCPTEMSFDCGGSSPLIKRFAWIDPVAAWTDTIAVAAAECPL